MSAPLRFLGLAIVSYVGLRTASSALALQPIPTATPPAFPAGATQQAQAEVPLPPPGVPADMGPPPGAYPAPYGYPYPYGYPQQAAMAAPMMPPMQYLPYPVPAMMAAPRMPRGLYYPAPYPVAASEAPARAPRDQATELASYETGEGGGGGYEQPSAPLDQWPAIGTVGSVAAAGLQRTPGWRKGNDDAAPLDTVAPKRWSVDAWALLRPPRQGALSLTDPGRGLNPGLASAGALGGSQAGLRITWRPLNSIGVHVRASTALLPQGRGGQTMAGGEAALGLSWQPFRQIPVRLLAERRQRLGSALGGGRNDFAFLAEGGISDQRLPYGIRLDGYGQAGVVGLSSRDLFADGALTATYPFMPRLAIGGGVWGGIQPGLYRFDAGPRLSYQRSPRLRVHLDYRFRAFGNADPVSGPALTLAAGF
ncbi:hypothetical protein [Sphingomonas astaxanthinifaciens]|uniref:Uncharacterized protein n=1 Tax=Sphingomonas astaxanthinifaciens DSM 22298 TaxID=1123267 RepID=A0ABQ5Z6P7_9SPHN|nr:hypothetical protein [Sphingomonas astaxanthinifaciens]GLR46563.1 hypothetical protein GCM10007925_02740 [Sphingomonas astaxanthinifaciens DSM 22298]